MGVTIQFESHRVELPAIYLMEYDPEILEFYDQPPSIKLKYRGRNGRSLGVIHTADFFILRSDGAGWEEWKREEELLHLTERMPGRYVRHDDGWRCPPGKEYAASFGFFYRVRSSAEINWTFQRNLETPGRLLRERPGARASGERPGGPDARGRGARGGPGRAPDGSRGSPSGSSLRPHRHGTDLCRPP